MNLTRVDYSRHTKEIRFRRGRCFLLLCGIQDEQSTVRYPAEPSCCQFPMEPRTGKHQSLELPCVCVGIPFVLLAQQCGCAGIEPCGCDDKSKACLRQSPCPKFAVGTAHVLLCGRTESAEGDRTISPALRTERRMSSMMTYHKNPHRIVDDTEQKMIRKAPQVCTANIMLADGERIGISGGFIDAPPQFTVEFIR